MLSSTNLRSELANDSNGRGAGQHQVPWTGGSYMISKPPLIMINSSGRSGSIAVTEPRKISGCSRPRGVIGAGPPNRPLSRLSESKAVIDQRASKRKKRSLR